MIRCVQFMMALSLLHSSVVAEEPHEARLEVLFLGDQGHHRPSERAAQLIPVMAGRGIDMTYTEDISTALDPETLKAYDALIIYANIEAISPEQERALLDYVAAGGGFVPIHCASYCFLNSQAYVDLVGAQFLRHGTGEFETEIVDPSHPIMDGFEPFRTWDETYVHTRHNPEKHLLQVRADEEGREPWTWVRTHGDGRVFYTAYGHDARTWTEPGFQDLIERGIRWTANRGAVFDSRPRAVDRNGVFSYIETDTPIPNYLAGEQWGTQGEPLRRMQEALKPAESRKRLVVPNGFRVELFASEPDILKPLCMAWDHLGRLWITESVDYPNTRREQGEGRDRITICEDTTGDGRADSFTVFAEGLNIPTSLTFAQGGVIVHQAPDTLFLKDTDGDDRADIREVLFTGWGVNDTHAGPSNLRYGLDNWLYGIVGYSAFQGQVGDQLHRFGQGFYRFRPDGSALEFLRSTSNNSWGVGMSEEGLIFGSTANGCPSVFLSIPNRYYEAVRGWAPTVLRNIADSNRFFPITEKVRQVDWHGGFTAAAGHALYTARTYPDHYWNSSAFVTEPTGHLVATFTLERRGTDFAAHYGWNQLASDDEWTAPIMAEVGPDGHVWIIDWYNYIVQHNPTPQGFETGKGNAYETPLRDKTHGRIYRVVYEGAPPAEPMELDPEDAESLVSSLSHDNMFWRLHAQRLLVERGKTDVVPALVALSKDQSIDSIGMNPGAIHALWTLHGLGAIEGEARDAAIAALGHPSAGVRQNAVRVLPIDDDRALSAIIRSHLLHDDDPHVRLSTLLALSERPESEMAAGLIVEAIASGAFDDDRWLGDAAVAAAAAHARPFLEQLAAHKFDETPGTTVLTVADRVAEHEARGAPAETIGTTMARLASAHPDVAQAVIAGISRGWPEGQAATIGKNEQASMATLLASLPAETQGQIVDLANRWGAEGFEAYTAEIATRLLTEVDNDARTEEARLETARQFITFRRTDAGASAELISLITPQSTPAFAAGLVSAIGRSAAADSGTVLVEAYPSLTPVVRSEVLRVLLSRADWSASLIDGIEQGIIPVGQLALDQKQVLMGHPDAAIAERASTLLARGGGLPNPDRQRVIDELAPVVLAGGNPTSGRAVYETLCSKCHQHSGEGGKVGPDLTGMAAHPAEELLVHILDPSREVEGNFVQYTVATIDGRILSGLLAAETRTSLELIDTEGKSHTILRDDLDEFIASDKSVMPEGFEQQATPEQLADLITFLTRPGKYLPLDLRKAATVVSTRGMFFDEESRTERLVFDDWSTKTVEGVPFQLVDPQGDRVPNAILLHGPQGRTPPRMPRVVELPVNAPAEVIHLLGGVGGWSYPFGDEGSISMIVRLHYADGTTEDHPLRNGIHLADYIRRVDVPGSTLAFELGGRQLRYLTIRPERPDDLIERIELRKGRDASAPIVMAVTVEVGGIE
ncbi:PVC-type heme-binding CxxCH protein [Tautonia rosea]|uniref:PVC-type heme-binding CxxCH protein n=1 Tax=Tautonia rosea TaxID=2728037 RepID=UPI0028F3F2E5|nr:PVC-type heme-binding CxxCH protein [Tautonia rosea]